MDTPSVSVRDMVCHGGCVHASPEECTDATHVVFPYRGIYLRHVARDQAVADANHVLFFNAGEGYRVAHPIRGSDASLSLRLDAAVLEELAPQALLNKRSVQGFRVQHRRIDSMTQARVAGIRHHLGKDSTDRLHIESLALELVSRSLGPRTSQPSDATHGQRRLADRVKVLLASDLSRRWTLAEIGAGMGASPVYLTQVFRRVEGMPLYRYHLQLRLARALDLLATRRDVSSLAADLGFSSHSHFTAAFRQVYGTSPTTFRCTPGTPTRLANKDGLYAA
jgi:AraC-like DNA-binding protein